MMEGIGVLDLFTWIWEFRVICVCGEELGHEVFVY